jgi:uncharacterized cysteine cluster protein YcgN (CxxCxxCC family)
MTEHFWKSKTLVEMTPTEWEALCDHCGRCCLNKLEDTDTGELHYTNVACHQLDLATCRCRDYPGRAAVVAGCLVLSLDQPTVFEELPDSCAYRLLFEGKALPDWHPLRTGDPESVRHAGISIQGRVVSESFIHPDQLAEHVVTWVQPAKATRE